MSNISKINGYLIEDTEARNQIENIEKEIDNICVNSTIVIGDSYLMGQNVNGDNAYDTVNNWGSYLKNLLGLSDNNFYRFGEGGSGFYKKGNQNHNFIELLQVNESQISDKSLIKNIIVCGGCNDNNASSSSDIEGYIKTFIDYCKVNYINATVYIGMVGGYNNPTEGVGRNKIKNRVYPAYNNSSKYGGVYMTGIESIMQNYIDSYSNDKVHPSINGQKKIAGAIYQFLKGGSIRICENNVAFNVPTNENIKTSTLVIQEKLDGHDIRVSLGGSLTLNSSLTVGLTNFSLGILDNLTFMRYNETAFGTGITVPCRLSNLNYTKQIGVNVDLYFSNAGELKMQLVVPSDFSDASVLIFHTAKGETTIFEC